MWDRLARKLRGRERVKETVTFALAEELLGLYAVVFREDGCEWYLTICWKKDAGGLGAGRD
jgi:hypothetical protein